MSKQNVNATAKIVNSIDDVQPFQMGTFAVSGTQNSANAPVAINQNVKYTNPYENSNEDVLSELKKLANVVNSISQKVNIIESEGVKGKDLDKQVVDAIRDLKQYAKFFEQASFALETKVLKTSIAIAKKIISIEISQNSTQIAKETISQLLGKIKTASKVSIHLHPKDYLILKNELQLESFITIYEDLNVLPGGVVIASDLGNFDGNVDAKVATMLESLETLA